MFTYVELSNFKSFGHIRFDFKKSKNDCKKFVAIYGENGSGKSNFVSAIELLSHLTTSFVSMLQIEHYKKIFEENKKNPDFLKAIIDTPSDDIASKLKKCRMIDSNEPTKIKYGFSIDNVEGYYSIVFDEKSIIEEELYYLTNKQRGILYHIEKENQEIQYNFSSYLFKTENYKKQMMEKINMYWGKHSFLALVLAEKRSKNEKFIYDNLSINMLKVLDCFMHVFILCKATNSLHTGIICGSNISISDFDNINIESNDKKKLQLLHKIEKIIKNFYVQAYTDIIDVYYKATVTNNDNKIYKLYVKKIIANKVRTIPFEEESAGTQRVLSVLRAILEAINGQTVVYDEIDDGIHDLLMCNILLSVQNDIKGQLIITTHNTLLLEDLNPKSAYVIYSDVDGNKEARCIDDYDIRIQSSNNQRKLYLNGVFGGIPYSSQIDYSSNDYKFDNLEE